MQIHVGKVGASTGADLDSEKAMMEKRERDRMREREREGLVVF